MAIKRLKYKLKAVRYHLNKIILRPLKHYECPCCGHLFIKPALPKRDYCTDSEHVDTTRYSKERIRVYCPNCMSMPRHRILTDFLNRNIQLVEGKNILYFSVERSVSLWLKKKKISFRSADLFKQADLKLDMQNTGLPDCSEEFIIANHVLEHVPDYKKTIEEIYRILKPGGVWICSFPIDESYATVTEEAEGYDLLDKYEIIKRYGQEDHRRIFGRDSKAILTSFGFEVELINGNEADTKILPVSAPADYDANYLFICRK